MKNRLAPRKKPDRQLGPCMLKLNERQQLFVLALMEQGDMNYTKAAQAAGYGKESDGGLRVQAHHLAHNPNVLAAIREEAHKRMQASVSMAASNLTKIANDPLHKDQLKAVNALLNRGGLHETIEHRHVHEIGTDAKALMARIGILAQSLGMDPVKVLGTVGVKQLAPPKEQPVDAEFKDIVIPTIDDWTAA